MSGFVPGLQADDACARYWLGQVTLRLRREVGWLWRERGDQGTAALPAEVNSTLLALDLQRYQHDKQQFFASDSTARYLSEQLDDAPPTVDGAQGSFAWVVAQLQLNAVESFVLALALLPSLDSAAGAVIACCQNDSNRQAPTLALAQRLWHAPEQLLRCLDPGHRLFNHGLLQPISGWDAPLQVPVLVARQLLLADGELPAALHGVTATDQALPEQAAARVRAALLRTSTGLQVLPLLGASDAPLAGVAAACSAEAGLGTLQPSHALAPEQLAAAMTVSWLRGCTLYLNARDLGDDHGHEPAPISLPLPALPLLLWLGAEDLARLKGLSHTLPALSLAPLSYPQRLALWQQHLPEAPALAELARRFRYELGAIQRVAAEVHALPAAPTSSQVFAAARADLDLGNLAQAVQPRFALNELMLPPAQATQLDEIIAAMRNLTRVHHDWGTARPWNEGGLAVLFAGPPGTGKTMAAEAIAHQLELPLYRIDLSQVVNKYIGETEKNLRRLFDAADAADLILFFDEADALFGKRSEVKDAHDRYANLEISYLLERMERCKGLTILATNRRKDLDEAFLRRLRFAIEFPLPGADERLRIWRSVIPPGVDASALDLDFLAQRFALAGGHIRGIVFSACLQSADDGAPRRLEMPAVVRAIQREYQKLDRANSLDQFGPYAELVAGQRVER
jgi:vesicle-fusing ATPase